MHLIFAHAWQISQRHPELWQVVALGDDGAQIAQHTSTSLDWAREDIGLDGSTRKHDLYDAHFGPGNWRLEWVAQPESHQGWLAAVGLSAVHKPVY